MSKQLSDVEVIGIVLDISQRHSINGKTNLENVKKSLIESFRKNLKNDDIVYLWQEDVIRTDTTGAAVASISNYKSEGWNFDLQFSLRQMLYILSAEPHEIKTLLLISDRLSDLKSINNISKLNDKDRLDCNLICFDIGNHLPDASFAKIIHVLDSSQLTDSLKEFYGERQ